MELEQISGPSSSLLQLMISDGGDTSCEGDILETF
jgi:hypothetical protein